MTALLQPTPKNAALDLANRLLRDPELCGNNGLERARVQCSANLVDIIGRQFRHAVTLAAVVPAMQAFVMFIRALISPREVTRVAARSVAAQVTRRFARRARAVVLLRDEAVRVRDSGRSGTDPYAPVAFQSVTGKGPTFVGRTYLDFAPEAREQRPVHNFNGNKP